MKSTVALLLLLLFVALSIGGVSSQSTGPQSSSSCAPNEELAVLELSVGLSPQTVGYRLTCDEKENNDKKVWEAPVGTFSEPSVTIQESICADADSVSCTLFIWGGGSEEGTFRFSLGTTTIGLSPEGFPMPSAGYCFGPKCNQVPYDQINEKNGSEGATGNINKNASPSEAAMIGAIVGLSFLMCVLLIAVVLVVMQRKNGAVEFVEGSGKEHQIGEAETVAEEDDGLV